MLAFIGNYSCKADSKSRIVVPASFRKAMTVSQQTVFVLRKNIFEMCIDMYPYSEWEMLLSGLRAKLNPFDREHAAFLRELYRGAQEVEMDGNGRILLPVRLLEKIGVDKEMVMAGQDSKIEIWGAGEYQKTAMGQDDFVRMTGQIFTK